MKKFTLGAAAAGGAALPLRRLARKGRAMHSHCREMMHNHVSTANTGCQPE